MEPGATLAIVFEVFGEFNACAELLGEFDVFRWQVMWEMGRLRREREKEGFVTIALRPFVEEFDAFIHTGKWWEFFFGMWRVSPEGCPASEQFFGLCVVAVDCFLIGVIIGFWIVGLSTCFQMGIKAVGTTFFWVVTAQVPLTVITDVMPEANGFVDPGFLIE